MVDKDKLVIAIQNLADCYHRELRQAESQMYSEEVAGSSRQAKTAFQNGLIAALEAGKQEAQGGQWKHPDPRLMRVVKAAINLLAAVDEKHASKESPLRYTVPWGEVVRLREALGGAPDEQEAQGGQVPAGLVRCEFEDECNFCQNPQGGSFTRLIHNAEDCIEAEFYICGDCAYKAIDSFRLAATPATPAQAEQKPALAARGYVAFGAGLYRIQQTKEPGLVVTFRRDGEQAHGVGDRAAEVDLTPIPAEDIIVRLDFTTQAGLDSLEAHLREIRAEHWPAQPERVALTPLSQQMRDGRERRCIGATLEARIAYTDGWQDAERAHGIGTSATKEG